MNLTKLMKSKPLPRSTLRTAILSVLLGTAYTTVADTCQPTYQLGAERLHLPCVDWLSDAATSPVYQADLQLISADDLLFQWLDTQPLANTSSTSGAVFAVGSKYLYIPSLTVQTAPGITQLYEVTMLETAGVFSIVTAKPLPPANNSRPQATAISRQANLANAYQEIQLSGSDADGDTLAFELLAPSMDTGYTLAYINPISNKLYVKVDSSFSGKVKLSYRVTDGNLFSEPAIVTITVAGKGNSTGNFFFGSQKISAREFAGFKPKKSKWRGIAGATATSSQTQLPKLVDLSTRFPIPRSQGEQQSCVGWAVAYAVKSYQEGIELGWTFDKDAPDNHLFSPAFIYNQLNGGTDGGLRIDEALRLVVDKGIATLATMPYYEIDFTTQPSEEALLEAANYKAQSWAAVTSTNDIKDSLAKGVPVLVTMAVYESFKTVKGTDAVYNTADTYLADHAVVIVGYNDNFAGGGAFKVMNSFGTEWGNNGFFWLPYDFLPTEVEINGEIDGTLLSGAYVLTDAQNTTTQKEMASSIIGSEDDALVPSLEEEALPNLEIVDWQASYDPKVEGEGVLQYKILNSGTESIAAEEVDVVLLMSESPSINPLFEYEEDYYWVQDEMIPVELAAGQAVSRDETNMLSFTIPYVPSGKYYLHLVVAASEEVIESSLYDNVSSSQQPVSLINDLPDLAIDFWFVDLDYRNRRGKLEYVIVNQGNTIAEAEEGWKISLKLFNLDGEETEESQNQEGITLWEQTITEPLPPLEENLEPAEQPAIVVTQKNAIPFSFAKTNLDDIPAGTYELAFQVDSTGEVEQSYYDNDISFSGKTIRFKGSQQNPPPPEENPSVIELPEDPNAKPKGDNLVTNGPSSAPKPGDKEPPPDDSNPTNDEPPADGNNTTTGEPSPLPPDGNNNTVTTEAPPPDGSTVKKGNRLAEESDEAAQTRFFYNGKVLPYIDSQGRIRQNQRQQRIFRKTTRSRNQVIFPIDKIILMPKEKK
jgi:hypothetical protein